MQARGRLSVAFVHQPAPPCLLAWVALLLPALAAACGPGRRLDESMLELDGVVQPARPAMLREPACARVAGYSGRYGLGRRHRWAMAEKKPEEFHAGEPVGARWVLDLASVDSE